MRKSLTFLGGIAAASMLGTAALADCGEVSMTEMNWPSSQVITHTAKFLMEQGYGCTVTTVPSATVTSPMLCSTSPDRPVQKLSKYTSGHLLPKKLCAKSEKQNCNCILMDRMSKSSFAHV